MIDKYLKWKQHIHRVSNSIRRSSFIFSFLSKCLPLSVIKSVFHAFIYSVLTYCLPVWGGAYEGSFREVEVATKSVLRLIFKTGYLSPSKPLFSQLDILPPRLTYVVELLKYFHKHHLPNIHPLQGITRSNSILMIPVPYPRCDFFKRQFSFLAPRLYIELPPHIKLSCSFNKFKNSLIVHFKNLYKNDMFISILRFI